MGLEKSRSSINLNTHSISPWIRTIFPSALLFIAFATASSSFEPKKRRKKRKKKRRKRRSERAVAFFCIHPCNTFSRIIKWKTLKEMHDEEQSRGRSGGAVRWWWSNSNSTKDPSGKSNSNNGFSFSPLYVCFNFHYSYIVPPIDGVCVRLAFAWELRVSVCWSVGSVFGVPRYSTIAHNARICYSFLRSFQLPIIDRAFRVFHSALVCSVYGVVLLLFILFISCIVQLIKSNFNCVDFCPSLALNTMVFIDFILLLFGESDSHFAVRKAQTKKETRKATCFFFTKQKMQYSCNRRTELNHLVASDSNLRSKTIKSRILIEPHVPRN